MDIDSLIRKAEQKLGYSGKARAYFSPGRINLIGEHIDYNGGHVLPCALEFGTYGIASVRNDEQVICYSENFDQAGIIIFSLNSLTYESSHGWANYVKGVVKEMNPKKGFNLYVKGEIPPGAGLSSSASLEMLVAIIINDLFGKKFSELELVKIAHRAENKFIGVNCGIMDQFVIGMAKEKQAMLLNTATLAYSSITVDLEDKMLVIANTNKQRQLSESKYNERREECNTALSILNKKLNIFNLCDLTYNEFLKYRGLLKDDTLVRRVAHVVSENERTREAFLALKNKYFDTFGRLLNESHKSLRENYQVTGFELDTMVNLFNRHGAMGARMTGAGFGGCAIALVSKDRSKDIIRNVAADYKKTTELDASFYPVNFGSGARKL